ncbi:MAG: VanW family protein [Thermoleophilia bacterium]|nr:VanW family protein [Thermoleophilia bacterium]
MAIGGLGLLAGALAAARDDGTRIPEGVTIGGLDVGGLRTEVARSALRRHAKTVVAQGVVSVVTPDRPGFAVRISPSVLGARPRIDEALRAAQDSDSFRSRLLGAVGLGGGKRVPLRWTLDGDGVELLVDRVQSRLGRRPRPATVEVTASGLKVVAGRAGRGIDEARLIAALDTLPSRISLPVSRQPAQVSVDEARRAKAEAQALLDAPPAVRGPGGLLRLTAVQLRTALRFRAVAPRLDVGLDPGAVGAVLRGRFGGVERAMRDARIVPHGQVVDIVDGRPGRGIDDDAMARALLAAAPGATVRLIVRTVQPDRTAADLRALGITRQVSEFTTPYACCQPRVTNIQRAVELLDGRIIAPGARLSLNEVLGQRTLERGFVSAPQIAGGKFEEAVGGGVSQVATTLYNAAFFAGLDIVTHTPHEFYISRYPMGREATLSWGGPELVVRNDWPAAVYVSASATSDSITVRMYSDPLDRRVETTSGAPTDPVDPQVKTEVDPALPPGEEVVDMQMGTGGFTIGYTRKVYRGAKLLRDETYRWTYHPENGLVRTGPSGTGTTTDGTTAPDTPDDGGTDGSGDTTTDGTTTGTGTAQPPAPG